MDVRAVIWKGLWCSGVAEGEVSIGYDMPEVGKKVFLWVAIKGVFSPR